ncbi:pleiotropic drug resistance ABC transporter [Sparassis latifolia]|uniref:Brefeldin A resistance protein n=1 Tax=Sparassis crispa TaxID=139825 RepID=A0A401GMM6_9APHY|nr:Brefeldin A resistance protein [Sparassis crispa]GBE83477.1 Brefeldin A resistance protein [Sparassis crispa]
MDPEQLSQLEGHDSVPELPLGTSAAAAHGHAAHNNFTYDEEDPHQKNALTRTVSHASHVEVDMFDPSGMSDLRQTLTHMSTHAQSPRSPHSGRLGEGKRKSDSVSVETEATLTPVDGPFDFEKTLRQIIKKSDKSDIKRRELGVVFQDLRVRGLGASATYQPTLGSVLSPLYLIEKVMELRHPHVRDLLSGFEGVVRPGEMLLVLGRPGAGCSTFLRTLANQRSDFYAVEGDVSYDSFTPAQIHRSHRGDVQYSPEDDVHFPTLTVDETIRFAARTRTPQQRIGQASRDEHIEHIDEVLITLFGLRHARNTLVGDASIRGISGGEKKRVSISEMLATRSLLSSWDNSTRGLDASTALEFVQALRLATDIVRLSTIVSIYQAGESLYNHFDKVCVIYEGKMAYFGPADRARQYFIDMGYEPANRQTTADFLVAVTDPGGRIVRSGFESRVPRTAIEFADTFKQSELAQLNRDDMQSYRDEFVGKPQRASIYSASAQAERAKTIPSKKSSYIISVPMQVRAVMLRRVQIIKGAKMAQVLSTVVFVVEAVIVGTIFLRLSSTTATYFSRGGVLFFALMFAAIFTMAEIPALFAQRPIVQRHAKAAMYHPFVDSLALTLVDVPMTFVTVVGFSIILYFVVDLQQSAGQFFTFLLLIFSMTITMKAWFRGVAAAFNDPAPAQTIAGLSTLLMVLYTGYAIPQPYMIGALRWITYINPIKYGFEGLMVNEFNTLNGPCAAIIPQGPGYENVSLANQVCTTVGSVSGQQTVNGLRYLQMSFGYLHSHLWRNFGIILTFMIGFIAALLLFTEFNTSTKGQTSVTLFKRGSKTAVIKAAASEAASDEEKPASTASSEKISAGADAREVIKEAPAVRDTFSFQNLSYVVPVSGGHRQLLDNVTGYVASGKLTALMGESGAGKTTLLNVLSERTSGGVVSGERFMNGQSLPIDFKSQTGYCQQMDTHLSTASVREALLFSAKMRQPASVSLAEKEAYVEKCMKMCGLEEFADAIVGSLGVEQRKRTTIGVELVAKPSLIFLDEPTSGLDSQSAWAIVCFLRDLADSGQSIVCTIHQPSGELFEVFDRLLLLRKGGQVVYFGDIGRKSSTLVSYFESHGGRRCDEAENPAEYILEVIGAGATAVATQDWHEVWKSSREMQTSLSELDAIHAEGHQRPPVEAKLLSEFPTTWGYQLYELFIRNAQTYWRDPTYLVAKLALNIVSGLLIGFTFFKAKDSIQGTQNRLFAVFMSLILTVAMTNQLQVPFFYMRGIYEIRERYSSMYSWTALVTSQILIEIPWNILGSSLYFVCWYWTVGFPSSRGGFSYLMYGIFLPLYYTTIGQAVAAMSPNAEIAALLFSFLFSFVLSFNGVLQPFSELGWWRWMYHVSPFTYVVESMVGQVVGRNPIVCSAAELVPVEPPTGQTCSQYLGPFIDAAGGYLTNGNATSQCLYCAYSTTDAFLGKSFNIFYSLHWRDLGILCAFIGFNIAAVYACTYLFRIRSGSYLNNAVGFLKRRLARRSD